MKVQDKKNNIQIFCHLYTINIIFSFKILRGVICILLLLRWTFSVFTCTFR